MEVYAEWVIRVLRPIEVDAEQWISGVLADLGDGRFGASKGYLRLKVDFDR